ncbi:hypothetical protein F5Y08DRAFT_339256 [Xylaria arbuscula]|nr:hypothetical protein F5Y08DRAFT_339256 [Xylaria arbuscula]
MTSPQGNTFLSIPAEIRRKIYNEAGLIRGRCIPIVSRKCEEYDEGESSLSSVPGSTYSLLQVSKVVNEEVGILICAHNTLSLVYEEIDYGLAFLCRLSPLQCAALKSLSIQLYTLGRPSWVESPGSPIDPGCQSFPKARLVHWLAAAHHILSNTYQNLMIQLFCDTAVSPITGAVLQPFLQYPGHLKDLELELDDEKGVNHRELKSLAWRTVCCAKGEDASPSFPFFALPVEIRHHILTYTDLVTPLGEIYWNVKRGFNILRINDENCSGSKYCEAIDGHERYHQGCRFFSCSGNNSPATGLKCCELTKSSDFRCPATGYVCCRVRTGYSSRCRCWTNPRSLLVANRQLYHEAIRVLYSYNRVIVVPSRDFRTPLSLTQKRLDAAVFITRHVWPEVLNYLRDVEFVFPCINPASPDLAQNPYILDLCFAIDHLASNACMSGLHVTVYLTTAGSVQNDDSGWFHRQLRKHDAATALRAHSHFLSAFRSLKGIKNFFVRLEWGWRWAEQVWAVKPNQRHNDGIQGALLNYEIDMLELSLERMIMGDSYTPKIEVILSRFPSVWLFKVSGRLMYHSWAYRQFHREVGYIL